MDHKISIGIGLPITEEPSHTTRYTFIPDQKREDLPKLCHRVEIDLDSRKLQTSPKKLPPEEKSFGKLLLSQLCDDDFKFLETKHFAYKNKITETAGINGIEGCFDYDEVELNGLMYAYSVYSDSVF